MNFCCSRFNKLSGSVAWGDSLPNWFLTSATTCYFILLLSKMYMLFSLPKVALLKVCFSTIIKFNLIKSYLKWHELVFFVFFDITASFVCSLFIPVETSSPVLLDRDIKKQEHLWQNLSPNFLAEKAFNVAVAALKPYCAVCSIFCSYKKVQSKV